MEKRSSSEISKRNKAAIGCYVTTIAVITIAYLLEVIKGGRTLTYFIINFLLMWVPASIVFILQMNARLHEYVKYVILVGFAIPWAYMLFTANNNLVFTYALVIMIALNAYADRKFAIATTLIFNFVNIASVVYTILFENMDSSAVVTAEIQVLLLILCGTFNVLIAKMNAGINAERMKLIKNEKDNTANLLEQVMGVSGELTKGIEQITEKMRRLDEAMDRTCFAMEEVSTGTGESSDSVQTQIIMTEEIQNRIMEVNNFTDTITNSIKETGAAIDQGNRNMSNLEKEVELSVRFSKEAADELQELENSTKQMQTIIDLINNVADQTSLLALNASIEAARAGEAGRGFSVVAGEISNLANQTQSATGDINALIGDIDKKLMDVDKAIKAFIEGSQRQHVATVETVRSFETISVDADNIMKNANGLAGAVERLTEANATIVDAVQNISAVMEEVSAHSKETYESSKRNSSTVDEMMHIVDHLNEQAKSLK